jgi:rootletin
MQRQIQTLQTQLAGAEQEHSQRLIDLTSRHRQETEMETERLRSAQLQAEKMLEARERAHRQRVKGLEETVSTLKDQLSQEMRKRQQYISRSVRAGDDINDIRSMLDQSLTKVAMDPELDPLLLEQESRRLDESLGYRVPSKSRPRTRGLSPGGRNASPLRGSRSMASPAMRRSTTSPSPVPLRSSLRT